MMMTKKYTRERETIMSLMKLSEKGLRKVILRFLRKHYDSDRIHIGQKYIMALGDIPVALAAHMDTVFKELPKTFFYDQEKTTMWSPDGMGADDRAGIYAIITIIQSGYRPTVIFTTEEECGGLGAAALVTDFPSAPTDLKYVIQLDRRGANDCVFYDCDNIEFVSYVESFGFKEEYGSFTDISTICPVWGIAGVNLSVGYYNEHSFNEILNIAYLHDTMKKVKRMLNKADRSDHFIYIPLKYSYHGYGYPYGWDYPGADDEYEPLDTTGNYGVVKCAHCGESGYVHDMVPVTFHGEVRQYYCPDCCADNVEWCEKCYQPFPKIQEVHEQFCPQCRNLLTV